MGNCASTSGALTVDPINEDSFKQNQTLPLSTEPSCRQSIISNSSGTDRNAGLDSYDHGKYKERMQLYEAVYTRNWRNVTDLMESTKIIHSADYIDRYKRTCLHWACIKSAPLPILQNLIAAYNDAVLMQDYLGKTPLHLACEFGYHASVYLLLGVSSQGVLLRDTENGRTPLAESLVCSRPASVIECLLNSNPKQVIIPDNKGNIPTVTFFMTTLGLFMSFTGKVKGTWSCCNDNIEDLIEIARLLLHAEIQELDKSTNESQPQDHPNKNQDSNILHDAIMSPTCPLAFVEFLLSFYPELANDVNSCGDLPIHVAAALAPDSSEQLLQMYKCNACGKPQSDNAAHYYRRDPKVLFRQLLCHDCINEAQICDYKNNSCDDKHVAILKALLSINPQHAQRRNQGDLTPLDIAIKAGHCWDENSWNEITDVRGEITTISTSEVEIKSNPKISIPDSLEISVESTNLTRPGVSEPTIHDNSLSLSSIMDILGTSAKMESTDQMTAGASEPPINDDSLQASLSSNTHNSKWLTEEGEEATDDSSQVSVEKTSQSFRTELKADDENNISTTNPSEDEPTNNLFDDESTSLFEGEPGTDSFKDGPSANLSDKIISGIGVNILRSILVSSQGPSLSCILELGFAALA